MIAEIQWVPGAFGLLAPGVEGRANRAFYAHSVAHFLAHFRARFGAVPCLNLR